MDSQSSGIDRMIARLNESGIPFTRDVWIDENGDMGKEDYGIVEITGSPMEMWGDDRMVYQRINGNVILYVIHGADEKAAMIQEILKGMDDVIFSLAGCQVITDMEANRWTWRFTMESYL